MKAIQDLPPSNSPRLALLHPTPEEKEATWNLNGQAWRGTMDLPTYLRRETYLENQAFTRDGGITFWILVDAALAPNERTILASCESLRKRALLAESDGQATEITSHGIGSVFCNPDHRGRGYAQRMINELGNKLDHWQQREGDRASFTVLYSDIGKVGYWTTASINSCVDFGGRNSIRNWVGMPFLLAISPYAPYGQMSHR